MIIINCEKYQQHVDNDTLQSLISQVQFKTL